MNRLLRALGLSEVALLAFALSLPADASSLADGSIHVAFNSSGECGSDDTRMEASWLLRTFRAPEDRPYKCVGIEYAGVLTADALGLLKQTLQVVNEYMHAGFIPLKIDSPGGDLVATLEFARWLRAPRVVTSQGPHTDRYVAAGPNGRHVLAHILPHARCASSCIVLLAAAYQRAAVGTVSVHRPFFTSEAAAEAGYADLQTAYRMMRNDLKRFFEEVNISDRLVDIMWSVSSDQSRVLTEAELSELGLTERDAILSEMENASVRKLCGVEGPAQLKAFFDDIILACASLDQAGVPCLRRDWAPSHPGCACFEKTQGRDPADSCTTVGSP